MLTYVIKLPMKSDNSDSIPMQVMAQTLKNSFSTSNVSERKCEMLFDSNLSEEMKREATDQIKDIINQYAVPQMDLDREVIMKFKSHINDLMNYTERNINVSYTQEEPKKENQQNELEVV